MSVGESLTLICSASIQEGVRGTPQLTWTREGDALQNEATSSPPFLTFSTLRTSHGGEYTCSARLTIPEAGVDVTGTNTTIIFVMDNDDTNTTTKIASRYGV